MINQTEKELLTRATRLQENLNSFGELLGDCLEDDKLLKPSVDLLNAVQDVLKFKLKREQALLVLLSIANVELESFIRHWTLKNSESEITK